MNTQDVERIERYIRERYETGQAFDNMITNIKQKQKNRYMNIKVKAGLTVVIFFSGVLGGGWIINSIPEDVLINIFLGVVVLGCIAFSYWIALEHYEAKQKLEEIEKENEAATRVNEEPKSIDTHIWKFDDGASIRPPRGRRMPKKGEDSKS